MNKVSSGAAIGSTAEVTVIIPTMADMLHRDSLFRAIDSVIASSSRPVHITVVANGNRRSADVENALHNRDDIELLSLDIGSLPLALLTGRQAVKTPYFAFLDDDDEYLPGAIDARVAVLAGDDSCDYVVTNGYRYLGADNELYLKDPNKISIAPLAALFRQNWLPSSCAGLFRSERIGVEYFEESHSYAEWTWLAFRLCMAEKKVAVLDQPTFRINDTPNSLSKTSAYIEAYDSLYQKMLAMNPPKSIVATIRMRIGRNFHYLADSFRKQGKRRAAWKAHFQSLLYPGGWRYLFFSRHLTLCRPGK
ncbi:MAG: glycosyltransferase family 2 protein [Azonexus sp.]|jgi:glycosyltransferase involved in cell wall biosynthesis|uniref:glycosyltransferase family 2 protein n=1 Tax=Azonexus sp. TaxID=1872668 RepID=UPI002829C224|nr:glycosyltransferase family 2 protein [Azonexus sp.]MDR0775292.1 glycosyltransferase family 2 protein [Azonexus sp.]